MVVGRCHDVQNVNELVDVVFSGLSPLIIEDVADEGGRILVRARTPDDLVPCPGCGASSDRVHGYHLRTVADVPVDGRRAVVRVRVRRLVCPTRGCRRTFREQVPGVLERYQRRTARLTSQVKAVVKELAGRAGVRLLAALAVGLSRHTALRTLLRISLSAPRVPRVIGVDDFALRWRHRYATVVIDAETHQRIEVLPDRTADTLEAWLRERPGVEIVCRDGSATYAEAIRRALPKATQIADRWHLWHNLCEAALSEVKAHSSCWATVLGGHEPGGDPDDLVAGQQQAVGQVAGEATAVLDGPNDRRAVGDRADPLEQDGDQGRVVPDGQRPADPLAVGADGHCDVDVLVRVDPHCHHRVVLLSAVADDGTDARALARGQTYCELTAQQASIKSLPARALALWTAVDISTESLAARVLRVTQRSRRTSPVEEAQHRSACTNRCSRSIRVARGWLGRRSRRECPWRR